MKFNQVCINCFKETKGFEICPHCGCIQSDKPKQLNHLYPFVELNSRYVIGKVINNGGFGVVYKAFDKNLQSVVAIKELFPTQNSMVTRVPGTTKVISYSGEKGEQFKIQKQRFLNEARTMSKLVACESIVDVYDFFEENNTAYLVMEFLDGITLREYMLQNPGKMSYEDTMAIIEPVINALIAVHNENIIHRDVSPDNVFITENGKVKLIDFGAAKLNEDKENLTAVVAKPGYTPPEQYRSKAKMKPYTDVYATGAMIYRMVTDTLPEESIDRIEKDELVKPSKLGANIPSYAEKSIMKAMALDGNARFKSMKDFLMALKGRKRANFPEKELKHKKIIRWSSFATVIVIAGGAVAGGLMYKNNTGIIPSNGNHTITVWLTDKDKNDKLSDNNNSIWDTINKDYFNKFVSKQDNDFKVNVKVEYVSEKDYNNKFRKAATKPDIYRSDLVENAENYSADLTNLYEEIDKNGSMTNAYKAMKDKYLSSNEIAVRYDTLVTYCYNYSKSDKKSIYQYKTGGNDGLLINPNVFWRLSDKMGYIEKSDTKSVKKLAEYVKEDASKDLADCKVKFYIGTASENLDIQGLIRDHDMITYSYSQLPGDSDFYSFYPERFSISNDSSLNNKKASMFYLYYISTSDDVQYNVLKNSQYSYLSMLKSVADTVKKNSLNREIVFYDNASDKNVFSIDNADKIKEATDKLMASAEKGKLTNIDDKTVSDIMKDLKS